MGYVIVGVLCFWWGYSTGSASVRRAVRGLMDAAKDMVR